jgi:hypothetical protein
MSPVKFDSTLAIAFSPNLEFADTEDYQPTGLGTHLSVGGNEDPEIGGRFSITYVRERSFIML